MLPARPAKKFAYVLAYALCLAAAFLTPSEVQAAAGGVQNCTAGSTCTIGEFLFDDSSAPIAGATCTITSNYPDHSGYISPAVAMSGGGADGWYYHEFTAPAITGMYSTQVSCTVSGDTLSIDKSFEVTAAAGSTDPNDIASAVWNYSTRTVSSFGDLITNIWASATRTITGVGLSSGQLATQDDVVSVRNKIDNLSTSSGSLAAIKKTADETKLLLEKVVNKPIIENVLEESTPNVGDKLKDTRAMANQLYVNNQFLTSQSASLVSKWGTSSGKEILDSVIGLSVILGESSDSASSNTMFGQANWIKNSWNWDEGESIYNQIILTQKLVSDLKQGLADYQMSSVSLALAKQLVKNSLALEKVVGSTSDRSSQKTLFAKIATTQTLASSLEDKNSQIDKALKSKEITNLGDLKNQVIALNKVPAASSALAKVTGDPNSSKNLLLGLRGIVNSNLKLLSLGSGKTLVNVWLEVGSIIFKTLATNPSTLVSQDVEIKYYLPAEIKKEGIIKTDAGLTVEYDSEKDQLYVAGTFTLSPGQTRTFSVETKDIWEVTPAEIESIRKQADELYKPLEKTAYYAQGVALKSDINASLDQAEALQVGAVTPEDKIRSYREAEILKKSAEDKLAGMKDLVTQASAAGNLFGFVGGSQTIAVWGLIIIIAAGFIFMTVYMRTVIGKAKTRAKGEVKTGKLVNPLRVNTGIHPLQFATIVIVTAAISAGTTGFVLNKVLTKNFEEKINTLGAQVQEPVEPTPEPVTNSAPEEGSLGIGGQYLVVISDTPTGYLRVRETPGGVEIAQVKPGDKLPFLDEQARWYQVELESGETGWVSKTYSSKE